ncbi:MAG: rRNA maturation RNase YbeY [Burkholderiales bacterium]
MTTKPSGAAEFSLSVQYASTEKNLPTRAQFRRWVRAALRRPAQINLRVVDAEEGRTLNAQFRKKNYSTNVLTFVYDDSNPLSGDIVLCAPVIRLEAQQQEKDLEAHYAHLTLHGVLHLQGYQHEKNRDARIMEALETSIMQKLRYADPYCAGQS